MEIAQLSYNLHKSSIIGLSPFELATGQQPTMPLEMFKQKVGGNCPITYKFTRSWQQRLNEACESLEKASRKMKKYADKGRRP